MNALPPASDPPIRVLFVFAWLVVGGEETEVRLLASHLDPRRYRLDVIACFRKEGMPAQSHDQLAAFGIQVDITPYDLSFEDTFAYLARRLPGYDIVVSCQNVADIYPALESLALRPPLIEHGGLVSEALAGPKHLTSRYVGVCASIRDAAAARMPGRERHAVEIPSMVDASEFDPRTRAPMRAALGVARDEILVGWVGRLHAKKRVEDFIDAAALVRAQEPRARFVIIGGPDAFMPEYALALRVRAAALGIGGALSFLGDRPDVPALLCALDVFVWLSRGDGMPRVIAEAGAAGRATVATADNGAAQRIEDGVSGVFVPHEDPPAAAAAILRLAGRGPEVASAFRRGSRRIERAPGRYDFSGWRPMLAAARRAGAEVIWDLMHYGWPNGLDIWSPAFVTRFAAFARAAARHHREMTDAPPSWCPVNEISFFAWAGGDAAYLNPFANGRGFELKVQLARAAIEAMRELRDVDPRARFVHCEPLIAIHHDPATGLPRQQAEGWHDAQYQAIDLISGRIWPRIGGEPGFLDIVGANYYPNGLLGHEVGMARAVDSAVLAAVRAKIEARAATLAAVPGTAHPAG